MDFRIVLAPLCAAGLSALVVAVEGGLGPLRVSGDTLGRGVGSGLVVLAAALALLGSWSWRRADPLRGSAPRSLDDAVAELRAGRAPGWGVYEGRLGASEPVVSPGGVACAFYDAEVRTEGPQGRKGELISQEQAHALLITVRGERAEAAVSFTPSALVAPEQVRRWQEEPRLVAVEAGELAEGEVEEVLSYERVGRLGERCLVVGELHYGPAPGSYVLRGRQGGPAMLVVGEEGLRAGQALGRRAWGLFSAAGALSVVAAFVLSRAL